MPDSPTGKKYGSINQERYRYGQSYWNTRQGQYSESESIGEPLIEELIPQPLRIRRRQRRISDGEPITETIDTSAIYDSTQAKILSSESRTPPSSSALDARCLESYWDSSEWDRSKNLSSTRSSWSGQSRALKTPSGSSRSYRVSLKQSGGASGYGTEQQWKDKDRHSNDSDVWGLYSQLRTALQPHIGDRPATNVGFWESDDFLRQSRHGISSVEATFTESSSMDMELLQRIRSCKLVREESHNKTYSGVTISSIENDDDKLPDTPIRKLIYDTKALTKPNRSERENPTEIGGNGSFGPLKTEYMEEYVKLLEYLEEQGKKVDGDHHSAQRESNLFIIEHALSNNELAESWICEELNGKFKRMSKETLGEERHQLRMAIAKANKVGDGEKVRALISEKQRMTRRAFAVCKEMLLTEVEQALEKDISKPILEIEELYSLHRGQQLLLNEQCSSMLQLFESLDKRQRSMIATLEQSIPLLLSQLDAVCSLIDIGAKPISSILTSIDRLSAKDIYDRSKREAEKGKRLLEPEALKYLFKASEDLKFTRLWTKSVISGFKDVEMQFREFGELALDVYVANDACLAFAKSKTAGSLTA